MRETASRKAFLWSGIGLSIVSLALLAVRLIVDELTVLGVGAHAATFLLGVVFIRYYFVSNRKKSVSEQDKPD